MYTRTHNSQLYVKRDSSGRSLFVILGNDVKTLKINDYNSLPAMLKFHHLSIGQPATVHYFGANNCHALCYNIYNLIPNQSMYNCREKCIYLRTFSFVFSRKKCYIEKNLEDTLLSKTNRRILSSFASAFHIHNRC